MKVVSSACEDCASSSRCAMRARSRVIGTRCSLRAPAAGARADVPPPLPSAGFLPRKSTTSDLVSRPSRPEAGMAAGSSRFSSTRRRTEGLSLPASLPSVSGAAALAAGAAAGGALAVAAAAGAGALGVAAAPSSITASTWPLLTTVPLATRSSRTTPLAGAGTSRTTLSVSRSARFSSRRIASPGCLCQVTRVASATDSGSCGTRISVVMSAFGWERVPAALPPAGRRPPRRRAVL